MIMHYMDKKSIFLRVLATTAILLDGIQKTTGQDFSYDGQLGPDHWSEKYQSCKGKYQSPINIDLVNAKRITLSPIKFIGFDEEPILATMTNNGHTVQINMDFKNLPSITGGPLNDSYYFAQFHFHWGDNDTYGSEDLINNHSFPVELHMVFYRSQYEEFENAVNFEDGVAVLAYFYELSNETNMEYENFLSHLNEIITPGLNTKLLNPPMLNKLIVIDSDEYFTYRGSLTTPPCSEAVVWIDFVNSIPISSEQINKFRNLYSSEGQHLTHNFRPVQPLNGRDIYLNTPVEIVPTDSDYEYNSENTINSPVVTLSKDEDYKYDGISNGSNTPVTWNNFICFFVITLLHFPREIGITKIIL